MYLVPDCPTMCSKCTLANQSAILLVYLCLKKFIFLKFSVFFALKGGNNIKHKYQ